MSGIELIDGAGHWVQQEQPVRLSTLLLAFIKEVGGLMPRIPGSSILLGSPHRPRIEIYRAVRQQRP